MMGKQNLISIIMPVYNGERFVGKAIESCLHQNEKQGWELVVVNDGSLDSTVQVIEKYLDDPRIKLTNQENKGIASARNSGILESSGNYIAFLDADDCYLPHTIGNFLAACGRAQKSLAMFYCDYLRINEQGETIATVRVKPPMKRPDLHLQFLLPNLLPVLISTTIIRRDALEKIGVFDERFPRCEDIQLFARIVERYDIAKLGIFSTGRRTHPGQATKNRCAGVYWREEYNIEYLRRHDFCYFCTTHDREKQAGLAERYGDLMLKAPEPWGPWPRTAMYFYQLSLSMKNVKRVHEKLKRLEASETAFNQLASD